MQTLCNLALTVNHRHKEISTCLQLYTKAVASIPQTMHERILRLPTPPALQLQKQKPLARKLKVRLKQIPKNSSKVLSFESYSSKSI